MKQELEFHAGALPNHTNPDDEAERLPLNYLQLIIRYKWRLMAGLLVGLVLGHLLYVKAGPEYEAFAEILVQRKYAPPLREQERMLAGGSVPSEHVKLILSPLIASEAVKIGHLDELKTLKGEPDPADGVLDSLKIKRVAGQDRSHSNVFDVRYTGKYPDDASKILASVISAYEEYLKVNSNEQSSEVQQMAKAATQKLQEQLDQKNREYDTFIQSVPEEFRAALGSKPQLLIQTPTAVAPQDVIQSLGEERNRNRIKMADLRSRQQAVERAIASGESREAIEQQVRRFLNTTEGRSSDTQNRSTEVNIYQSQLIPLLLKEKELSREFGRDWPELQSVRRSIDTIVQTYRKLGIQLPEGIDSHGLDDPKANKVDFVRLYLDEVKQQVSELHIKDEELGKLISEERIKSSVFTRYQTQDHELRLERDTILESWRQQLDREQTVAIEKDTNGYRMTRLSPVKHALVIKRMAKFYAAGAALCIFLVALTCVLQELADLTIKTVRDVRDILHQPVLGSICDFVVPLDRAGPTSGIPHPALRYLHAPSSVEAETYRTIRASFLVMVENMDAKIIMVSSPEPGDGKTTSISNLAVALAQSGKRILLIDGDVRRPAVHRMFRIPAGTGLAEVLAGTASIQEAIRPSVIEHLSIMTTGTPPANPAETLSHPELGSVLAEAAKNFDYVFLDAPPLLAVSDPCVMARHTDGVLLVVRLNKNTRTALIRVRQLLRDQDISVVGTAINGVPFKGGHEFGYTYYGEYAMPTPPAIGKTSNLLNSEHSKV